MINLLYKNSVFGELLKKILFIFIAISIFRLGVYIPLPFIDLSLFNQDLDFNYNNFLMKILNIFSGGAIEKFSILSLGVMPYISSSIIMQIMSTVIPTLIECRKEGEIGQQKINKYTRFLTVFLSIIQSLGFAFYIVQQQNLLIQNYNVNNLFIINTVLSLTAGSIFLMWLGEKITEKGIGNGISILIFSGIISNLPFEIFNFIKLMKYEVLFFIKYSFLILTVFSIVLFIIFFEKAQRKIIIHYAKRQQGRKMLIPQSSYLPLKLNMAGVIPPIFASSILMIPSILSSSMIENTNFMINKIIFLFQPGYLLYNIIFIIFIIFFCFFYTDLVFNSKDTASNLKKSGAFIIGVRPGKQTSKYIKIINNRLTFIGSIYITIVCLLPIFITKFLNLDMSLTFSGTSFLIVVVVTMDFISQIQSYLISNQYEHMMKKYI